MTNNNKADVQLQRISDTLIASSDFLEDIGLLNGKTGIALFFFHLARATGDRKFEEYAGELTDQTCESLQHVTSVDYAEELAGFGAGMEYMIQQRFIDADADEVLEDMDNVIREHTPYYLNSTPETFVGLGKYFTKRLESKMNLTADNPNQTCLSRIIQALSCPYNTYGELFSVIDFLSGVVPLGIEVEKTGVYLNYAVDKMETMVYEDIHFGIYPGQFNPLIAATLLCRASVKTGNKVYADRAQQYLQLYEPDYRPHLSSNLQFNTLKWSFLYRYLGAWFQNSELLRLSEEWLYIALKKEFPRNLSVGLSCGYAGAGMYLLSLAGQCGDDWLDIVPCHVEKITHRIAVL